MKTPAGVMQKIAAASEAGLSASPTRRPSFNSRTAARTNDTLLSSIALNFRVVSGLMLKSGSESHEIASLRKCVRFSWAIRSKNFKTFVCN